LSEKELTIALDKGRINYAFVGDLPALYWAKTLGVKIELGPIHSSGLLHIRLRKEKIALLPKINAAIDALMSSGEIQRKIDKYTKLKTQ
jgi:polar amino acid transport system substrate-binding protein